jgi:hypothetical protein
MQLVTTYTHMHPRVTGWLAWIPLVLGKAKCNDFVDTETAFGVACSSYRVVPTRTFAAPPAAAGATDPALLPKSYSRRCEASEDIAFSIYGLFLFDTHKCNTQVCVDGRLTTYLCNDRRLPH